MMKKTTTITITTTTTTTTKTTTTTVPYSLVQSHYALKHELHAYPARIVTNMRQPPAIGKNSTATTTTATTTAATTSLTY